MVECVFDPPAIQADGGGPAVVQFHPLLAVGVLGRGQELVELDQVRTRRGPFGETEVVEESGIGRIGGLDVGVAIQAGDGRAGRSGDRADGQRLPIRAEAGRRHSEAVADPRPTGAVQPLQPQLDVGEPVIIPDGPAAEHVGLPGGDAYLLVDETITAGRDLGNRGGFGAAVYRSGDDSESRRAWGFGPMGGAIFEARVAEQLLGLARGGRGQPEERKEKHEHGEQGKRELAPHGRVPGAKGRLRQTLNTS